jgi:hypothetical protein
MAAARDLYLRFCLIDCTNKRLQLGMWNFMRSNTLQSLFYIYIYIYIYIMNHKHGHVIGL